MIDAVNLYYLHVKRKLLTTGGETDDDWSTERILQTLTKAGIQVKMVDTLHQQQRQQQQQHDDNNCGLGVRGGGGGGGGDGYVIGNHHKIMLVDDTHMITGGRNIQDEYMTNESSRATIFMMSMF